MEPLFFKAENAQCLLEKSFRPNSFNGAAFFQSGKLAALDFYLGAQRRASMEPLFFKAENPDSSVTVYLRPSSFNGAAFFQSGK